MHLRSSPGGKGCAQSWLAGGISSHLAMLPSLGSSVASTLPPESDASDIGPAASPMFVSFSLQAAARQAINPINNPVVKLRRLRPPRGFFCAPRGLLASRMSVKSNSTIQIVCRHCCSSRQCSFPNTQFPHTRGLGRPKFPACRMIG